MLTKKSVIVSQSVDCATARGNSKSSGCDMNRCALINHTRAVDVSATLSAAVVNSRDIQSSIIAGFGFV